ncbi:MAG: cell division protein FtsK, partial [Burkholderiales bacterium PBB5]
MTFPLGSLHGDAAAGLAAQGDGRLPETARWRQQLWLLGGGALWLIALLALATHRASDPGFSTSGTGLALANKAGLLGAWWSDMALFLFGYSAWWLLLVGARAWLSLLARWLRGPEGASPPAPRWQLLLGVVLLMAASCALEWTRIYRLDAVLPGGQAGGVLGAVMGGTSMRWLGFAGSGVLWIALGVLGAGLALRFSWVHAADVLGAWIEGFWQRRTEAREVKEDLRIAEVMTREREQVVEEERAEVEDHAPIVIETPVVEVPKSTRVAKERQQPLFQELRDTKLPQVDLLDTASGNRGDTVTPESLEMTSRLIEKKLKDFGVEVRVVAASPGPVITRYEIEPATGVKGSQVVNLAKDLARALSLVSIRVVETIPGKNTMALELPNAKRQMIRLAEILGSQVYHDAQSQLTMGLGKDIVGNPFVADLAKMPHCLVAGTTGSGKSVGINAMILSLLYKAEARDVRLILIDPKMLEMSVYEGIPHLLCPVVTDMKQAANALNWCVGEMERRYKLMSKLGVRNLAGYNKKIDEAAAREEKLPNPFSLTPEEPEPLERLPFVVVVIDELADLMMVVGKKIEELIARLAQKARAAGIHLILATQRPSVDVITGLIKANIPTRLSF